MIQTGRISGVVCRNCAGRKNQVAARSGVVLAGGRVRTPVLAVSLARSAYWRAGAVTLSPPASLPKSRIGVLDELRMPADELAVTLSDPLPLGKHRVNIAE